MSKSMVSGPPGHVNERCTWALPASLSTTSELTQWGALPVNEPDAMTPPSRVTWNDAALAPPQPAGSSVSIVSGSPEYTTGMPPDVSKFEITVPTGGGAGATSSRSWVRVVLV